MTDIKKNVLIIDDDEDMLTLLSHHVSKVTGVKPATASTALDGLSLVEQSQLTENPFTVVLIDIKMPEINGYVLAKMLRNTGYTGMIVACTAAVSESGEKEARDSGIDAYLDKQSIKKETIQSLLTER